MLKSLPVLRDHKAKALLGGLTFIVGFGVYLGLNHFHYYPPRQLPYLWPDQMTPFIPLSLWLYVSIYPLMIFSFWQAQDLLNISKYFYSVAGHFLITALIFFLWPTSYPRHGFPLPQDLDTFTRTVFEWLRVADTPANCCPSLHVSCAFLSAFLLIEEKKAQFPLFLFWALLVAYSTMTTKQHYFLDVVGGFLMAVFSYLYFYKFCDYRTSNITGLVS